MLLCDHEIWYQYSKAIYSLRDLCVSLHMFFVSTTLCVRVYVCVYMCACTHVRKYSPLACETKNEKIHAKISNFSSEMFLKNFPTDLKTEEVLFRLI